MNKLRLRPIELVLLVMGCAVGTLGIVPELVSTTAGEPKAVVQSNQSLLNQLQDPEVEKRLHASSALAGSDHLVVEGLLAIAFKEDKMPSSEKSASYLAILLLGDRQCAAAIPRLVARIDWRVKQRWSTEISAVAEFPCARALLEMGQSSVFEVVEYLRGAEEDQVSDKAIELYAIVLKAGLSDQDRAVRFVQWELAEAKNKGNLKRLRAQLQR